MKVIEPMSKTMRDNGEKLVKTDRGPWFSIKCRFVFKK